MTREQLVRTSRTRDEIEEADMDGLHAHPHGRALWATLS